MSSNVIYPKPEDLPTQLYQEYDRLTYILLNDEYSFDEVLEKYATDEYRKYIQKFRDRRESLRKMGIIEN